MKSNSRLGKDKDWLGKNDSKKLTQRWKQLKLINRTQEQLGTVAKQTQLNTKQTQVIKYRTKQLRLK